MSEIDFGFPLKTVDRTFLPNFDFGAAWLLSSSVRTD